jgi:AraC-like DNA-binding protein
LFSLKKKQHEATPERRPPQSGQRLSQSGFICNKNHSHLSFAAMGSHEKTTVTVRSIAQNLQAGVTPDAIGLDISRYLGEWIGMHGRILRLNLREGFDLSIYHLTTSEDMEQVAASDPCVAVDVILQGSGMGLLKSPDGGDVEVPYQAGTTYVCVMQQSLESRMRIPKNAVFSGIDIRLSLDFLRQQKALPDLSSLAAGHPWHFSSAPGYWLGRTSTSRQLLQKCSYILKEVFRDRANDLAIEGKALDILADTFSQLAYGNEPTTLPKRQQRKMERARDLLLADLARTWTVGELAREAGVNEKSLKQGFRALYGEPVYQFLLRERLKLAKTMLEAGAKVADVSLSVGYANPSHFAYLFRREYGCPPSAVQEAVTA